MKEEKDADTPRLDGGGEHEGYNEKTSLLHTTTHEDQGAQKPVRWIGRVAQSFVGAVSTIVYTATAPARYIVGWFFDEQGRFSPVLPLYNVARAITGNRRRSEAIQRNGQAAPEKNVASTTGSRTRSTRQNSKRPPSIAESAVSSDSEVDMHSLYSAENDGPARHTRSRSSFASSDGDEIAPSKRSIRIKLHNEEASKQKKRRGNSSRLGKDTPSISEDTTEAAAAALKSPSSPANATNITKYPRAPQPPRPLVPKRQASYSAATPAPIGPHPHKKTLVIDLDETLIHSMSKGGRFTTGHMVEVKLQQPVPVGGGMLAPQVPILYYVHKRPHCDEFLRKISKWFNLIVFTASVQEYADPVINWLELERKYFYRRLYRQHCTFRNGSYIKDLSQVEPDLSKVMILDNSPMSYVFHEDNAIPIEGWISDPTDNDLLHLIPFLEGLQYVTDVRALLALRLGEPQSA